PEQLKEEVPELQLSLDEQQLNVTVHFTSVLCGNIIHKVYCGNFSVVKLSCSDTTVNNVYGLIYTFISIILPLVLILYTYVRILKVCFSGSKQTRQKAVSTCTPHLASLLNFSFGAFNNVYGLIYTFISIILPLVLILYTYVRILKVCFSGSKQTRQKAVSTCTPHLASLLNFSFGPLFNPVMYGLKMSKIRNLYVHRVSGQTP
ncbi:unnamed protein product, partial [Pleuronectes platessa]